MAANSCGMRPLLRQTCAHMAQKAFRGETTTSHAAVRHGDTDERGWSGLAENSQCSICHSPGRQAGSIRSVSHSSHAAHSHA